MNCFIIVFLIIFPVFSFSAEPNSELVQKAEKGDVEALVQLYEFYRDNEKFEKADSALNRAAEKGHVPSLKLVYQQTGKILSVGVEAAVNEQLFAPFMRANLDLTEFSNMDHLLSLDGVEEKISGTRRSVISQITDGKKTSLAKTSGVDDRMLQDQPIRPIMMDLIAEQDGSFKLLEEHEAGREYLFPPPSSKEGAAEETQESIRVIYEQTKTQGRLEDDNSVSITVVEEYAFPDEVFEEFKAMYEQTEAKGQLSRDEFILRMLTISSLIPEPTEDGTFRLVELKMKASGEFHLEKLDSLKILDRYVAYRLENNKTQMEYWLDRLKSLANTGDILALQMVYRITGEVLMEGYTKAVSNTADNFFAEDGNKAVTAIQNKKNINDSVMEKIKAPFGTCKEAF